MDLFFGASPVQKAVDAATSELLIGPDWTANVEIYEGINRSEDNGAEVLRCLARRMQHRNPQVISLALELLNACVSNCRERFHELVNQQPFLDEVVRVGLKGPSSQVRERALELILTWAEAFASKAHLANFAATYQRLRSQGTEFPARDMNAMAPVFTPAKHAQPQPQQQQQQPLERARSHEDENQYSWVSPEYIAKVRSELQEVMNTVGIVKEMLVACETPQAARQNETLRSLLELLREMSNRLTRLIVEVEHEKLVDLCIQINEHVCVPLIWYKTIVSGHSYTPPNLPMPADLYDAPKSPAPAGTESKEHKSDAAPSDHRPAAQGEADDPQDEFEALAMRRQQEQKQAPVDEFEALALRDAPSGAGAASATNVDQQIKEFEDLLGLSGSGNPPAQ